MSNRLTKKQWVVVDRMQLHRPLIYTKDIDGWKVDGWPVHPLTARSLIKRGAVELLVDNRENILYGLALSSFNPESL